MRPVKKQRQICIFVSTGRCGTQWLANALHDLHHKRACVTHEPIYVGYHPNAYFRAYNKPEKMLTVEAVALHFLNIKEVLKTQDYIEVGWPAYAAIPLFIDYFGKAVKIVHLVRHPVPTAMSLTTHGWYSGKTADWLNHFAELSPATPRVFQKEYKKKWNEMSLYEKCLFFWTEINMYGNELHERFPRTPYLQIKFEDIFTPENKAIKELTQFLGYPLNQEKLKLLSEERVDGFSKKIQTASNWKEILKHEQTLRLAEQLGYSFEGLEQSKLDRRYRAA